MFFRKSLKKRLEEERMVNVKVMHTALMVAQMAGVNPEKLAKKVMKPTEADADYVSRFTLASFPGSEEAVKNIMNRTK